uniref:Cna B-type domain-containing protein n=1 Tax=Eubacterium cellulosolvens TaxID=29322 RepID=UPI000481A871|nr:Cna B-type domain-containing protein [[Eubacterium] cellulosolvens]
MGKILEKVWLCLLIFALAVSSSALSPVTVLADGVAVGVQIDWDDDGDAAGQRPQLLTLQLLQNGAPYGDEVQVGGQNALWHVEYTNLPKGRNEEKGIDINYQVAVTDGLGDHYFEEERTDDGQTITIRMKYDPDGTLGGKKVKAKVSFDDRNNKDKSRPQQAWLMLTRNGEPFGYTAEVNETGKWKCEWTNLPADGEYHVEAETVPEGYEAVTEVDESGSFRVKYTHRPAPVKVSVRAELHWDDANNVEKLRPANLHLQLLRDDEPAGNPVEIGDGNGWKAGWEDLPAETDDGKKTYSYRVKLTDLPKKYSVDISGSQEKGYVITATHKPGKRVDIKALMAWNDGDNQAQKRPAIIHLQLMKGDSPQGDPVSLSEADNWRAVWPNIEIMPASKPGDEDYYSVQVTDNPPEYGFEITGDAEQGFEVKGTYTPVFEPTDTPVPTPTPTLTPDEEEKVKMEGLKPVTILVFFLAALLLGMIILLIVVLIRKSAQDRREEEAALERKERREMREPDDDYEDSGFYPSDDYEDSGYFTSRRTYGSRRSGYDSPYGTPETAGKDGNLYGDYTVFGSREEYGDRYGNPDGGDGEDELPGDDYDFGFSSKKKRKKDHRSRG